MKTDSISKSSNSKTLSLALQDCLIKTHDLYFASQNYHWNVEGAMFLSLHEFFGTIYTEQFAALDIIAERIRAIGHYPKSFEDSNFAKSVKSLPSVITGKAESDSKTMLSNLVKLLKLSIESCNSVKSAANKLEDQETEDLMVGQIAALQKLLWMANSSLK